VSGGVLPQIIFEAAIPDTDALQAFEQEFDAALSSATRNFSIVRSEPGFSQFSRRIHGAAHDLFSHLLAPMTKSTTRT
jgi:hypothetical protein